MISKYYSPTLLLILLFVVQCHGMQRQEKGPNYLARAHVILGHLNPSHPEYRRPPQRYAKNQPHCLTNQIQMPRDEERLWENVSFRAQEAYYLERY